MTNETLQTHNEKILIIAPSWVGDMMMAHSLLRQLKIYCPNSFIGVVAPNWSKPLLAKMPEVDEVFTMPVGHKKLGLGARWALAKTIRQQKYSHAIILPRSFKSALVPFFARIKHRISYKGEMRYGLINHIVKLDKEKLPMTVDRFVYLADAFWNKGQKSEIKAPKLNKNTEKSKELFKKYQLSENKPSIVLCPGAEYGPSKQWPENYYNQIAREYLERGYQVIVLGSPHDSKTADKVCQNLDTSHLYNLIGKTSLTEAIDIIAASQKVLTNDSGLMHIASALNIPLVAIYGSTSPEMTPPLSSKAIILEKQFDCKPCFERQCPHVDARLFHQCMRKISVQEVSAELKKIVV